LSNDGTYNSEYLVGELADPLFCALARRCGDDTIALLSATLILIAGANDVSPAKGIGPIVIDKDEDRAVVAIKNPHIRANRQSKCSNRSGHY
jgi:hypothetical protein